MWLKLLSFNAVTRETTEVCSLEPAFIGVICDIAVVQAAIEKHLDSKVKLAVCAATLPYFNDKPIDNQVAAFAYRPAGVEAYCGTELFVVAWE